MDVGTGPKVVLVEDDIDGSSWRAWIRCSPVVADATPSMEVTGAVGHGVVVVVNVTEAKVLVTLQHD